MTPLPPSITHLFLDAGNTLVFVNMEVVSRALGRRGVRLTPEELWRGEHRARRTIDTPEVVRVTDDAARWKAYFDAILRECGVERPDAVAPALRELHDYHQRVNLWEVVPPDVPPALEALRRRYRLGVISNSNGTVREKLHRVGLGSFFDPIVDSFEEKVEKPDPRLFRIAMERAGASPERSAHVGDFYYVDATGAQAAGMEAVLLDPGGVHADKPVRRIAALRELVE
jgi:putative hydrolase of the HAD superfamily